MANVVDFLKDVEVVLLGEATYGTQEFYQARASITLALIARHGFSALAVEAGAASAQEGRQVYVLALLPILLSSHPLPSQHMLLRDLNKPT